MKDITILSVLCAYPSVSVNCFERSSGYYLAPHSHDYWQVIVVTEGELDVITNNGTFHLTRGMVNVLPPHCEHSLSSESYCQVGVNFRKGVDELSEIYSAFVSPMSISVPIAVEYARQIYTLDRSQPMWLDSVGALAKLILIATAQADLVKKRDPRESAILEYIDSHVGADFSLKTMADALYMSPSHLERCCKRFFGTGVTALYNRKRFERACILLVSSDDSVGAVAYSLGFYELSNFSAFFKKYALMSPLEYRKRYIQKLIGEN